jgi:hypothetical protein
MLCPQHRVLTAQLRILRTQGDILTAQLRIRLTQDGVLDLNLNHGSPTGVLILQRCCPHDIPVPKKLDQLPR